MIDGRSQRRAVSAMERSLDALEAGDLDAARRAAEEAESLDQVGVYRGVGRLLAGAASRGEFTPADRSSLAELLGPGPLAQRLGGVPPPG